MSQGACLAGRLAAMGLDLPTISRQQAPGFVALLQKWNRTYNLTAIRDEKRDADPPSARFAVAAPGLGESALAGRRWADVGSGAGLPGIPLAIACPDLSVTSIETVEKKAAFQRQAKIELGLDNFTVENRRVEDMPAGGFDAVVSRAFAELPTFVRLAGHLLAPAGAFTP
jgi:16S rRNA (guanine527-N7)-methyltransferase